ncbi:lipid A biosynthesis lauroyl acyltransferase [Arenimonas caeni]|uniref:Lipid A biosynthesis lauroyl acyltransferase n=1 Tax=Arenimonas caeni TaxID=2058085 RepID=A0A2P6M8B5_9GAMM|nr:lipid A biosynthesis lauroyl acyltransferase [Arenimonas caeni]PRH82236.1 lipid A biosynthesis lauroyl acyltransferase [Arenimonas caeni]
MPAVPFASRCLYALAWCVGRLPRRLQDGLGRALGSLAWRFDGREPKVARRNLGLALPGLDAGEREALVRDVMRETGRAAFETLRLWTRPRADALSRVAGCVGLGLLQAAEAAGRGVIIAAPHYGSWELLVEFMAARGPFSLVYRVPESAAGDGFLRLARGGENVRLVPAEANAMRPLWRALQAGEVVGITPDHQPKLGGGEFAPFFEVPALTLSLIPKLAARTGAAVLMAYAERGGDGRYTVHFEPAPADIASDDLVRATTAMNAAVEAVARRDLRQYQWTYKRYTLRPPGSGEPNPYKAPAKDTR